MLWLSELNTLRKWVEGKSRRVTTPFSGTWQGKSAVSLRARGGALKFWWAFEDKGALNWIHNRCVDFANNCMTKRFSTFGTRFHVPRFVISLEASYKFAVFVVGLRGGGVIRGYKLYLFSLLIILVFAKIFPIGGKRGKFVFTSDPLDICEKMCPLTYWVGWGQYHRIWKGNPHVDI